MRQNVFILGATGNVGRKLVSQIASSDLPEYERHKNPTAVVGMADRQSFAVREGGFQQDVLNNFARTRQRIRDTLPICALMKDEDVLEGVLRNMRARGFDEDVVYVDVTAAIDSAKKFHLDVIENGGRIVTANKNPISRFDFDTYRRLTADPKKYGYSATTMAGLGAVPWISERVTIGDQIKEMTASLSGTVGFITDKLTRGEKLSEAIKVAREKGYTEPDFRDDLNGVDVARKLIILAREAGYKVDMEDIDIETFLPKEYFDIRDPEQCLHEIEAHLDRDMQARYTEAQSRGSTLKYLATFQANDGKPQLTISLVEVPLESAFGKLSGTDNRIEIVTGLYGEDRRFRLEGPGAGLDITASVVRRDLLNLQPHVSRLPLP